MAFEFFRRHQKKGLAALALMAMIAFTLDFNLFRPQAAGPRQNPVVFELAGKPIRKADLDELRIQRLRANQFLQSFLGAPSYFGDTSDEAMRDAYILQREADRLGMPATPEVANTWLRERFRSVLTPELFDGIYRENFTEGPLACTDTQLLADIANQIRLYALQVLPDSLDARPADSYLVTPLDIYNAFRDQNEKVSALTVPFPVDNYLTQVPEPKPDEIEAYYAKHKDMPPDPTRDSPGFRIPRQVITEYVTVDSRAIEDRVRAQLTDEELRAHYKEHEKEFPAPFRELPLNLFAGDPDAKLTPRTIEPFQEVREEVLGALAELRANEEVDRQFAAIRDDVMAEFIERYDDVVDRNLDAKERGAAAEALPRPVDANSASLVKAKADQLGLQNDVTPLMSHEDAAKRVPIGGASMGATSLDGGTAFADHVFDERVMVYEPFELAEPRGLRFLGWKLEDVPPRVPPLDEVRDQVVHAWKREQARTLAERDANAIAEKARQNGGDLKSAAGDRLVLPTAEIAKLSASIESLTQQGLVPPRATEIPEIPGAGDALRDALFGLKPGEVVVAPNAAKSQYYVLALNKRTPADLEGLFSPIGSRFAIETTLVGQATVDRLRNWMTYLREKAGATALVQTPAEAATQD